MNSEEYFIIDKHVRPFGGHQVDTHLASFLETAPGFFFFLFFDPLAELPCEDSEDETWRKREQMNLAN